MGPMPLETDAGITSLQASGERRRYGNPSVHEVVADVLFNGALTDHELQGVLTAGARYGAAAKIERTTVDFVVAQNAKGQARTAQKLEGYQFMVAGTPIVVRPQAERLTLNMVRSQNWPAGDYVGWEVISESLGTALQLFAGSYAHLRPTRSGLRYLNRLALPGNLSLESWLNVGMTAPPLLTEVATFQLRKTWWEIQGFPGLSATLGVSRIDVERRMVGDAPELGVLLDIDVFSPLPDSAPAYDSLREWFDRAHAAENAIFEACITDRLRNLFDTVI